MSDALGDFAELAWRQRTTGDGTDAFGTDLYFELAQSAGNDASGGIPVDNIATLVVPKNATNFSDGVGGFVQNNAILAFAAPLGGNTQVATHINVWNDVLKTELIFHGAIVPSIPILTPADAGPEIGVGAFVMLLTDYTDFMSTTLAKHIFQGIIYIREGTFELALYPSLAALGTDTQITGIGYSPFVIDVWNTDGRNTNALNMGVDAGNNWEVATHYAVRDGSAQSNHLGSGALTASIAVLLNERAVVDATAIFISYA